MPVAPVAPVLPIEPVAPTPVAPVSPVAPTKPEPTIQLKLPDPSVLNTRPALPPVIITLPTLPKFAVVATDKLYTPKLLVLALPLTCNVPKTFTPVSVIFTMFGTVETLIVTGPLFITVTLLPPYSSCLAVVILDIKCPSPTK